MNRQQQQRRIRLQCLVLGAAGAGKTSLLRRYFHKTFDSSRMPTIGSDFYTGRVLSAIMPGSSSEEKVWVNLQMWDTPGKERFALKRQPRQHAAVLSPEFLQRADAIMLVYDMTSSTSFTQLLKWYADLMELQKIDSKNSENPCRPLPILIVASKLDLFRNNSDENGSPSHPRRRRVPQRDVMGLNGMFRGNDFRYEYQVCPPTSDKTASIRTTKGNDSRKNDRRMEISSYLANRENWTNDWSYLESLLNSEDLSHPDREMVLLWCMRNGLKHYEVSAATGEGVSMCMEALLQIALASKEKEAKQQSISSVPTSGIDLHQRYASKEDNCFYFMRPLIQVFQR